MKNLHIISNEKFTFPYIKFINSNFKVEEHYFLIIDLDSREEFIYNYPNIKRIKTLKKEENFFKSFIKIISLYFLLMENMKKSEKIYFHGSVIKEIVLFLFIFRNFLKKSYWIIWGQDLYSYVKRKKSMAYEIYYKIEDFMKKNFKGYITHIEGDYRLAQKWYGAKGRYYNCFMYPSNLYKGIKFNKKEKEEMYVQIGNSADPSNNHFDILRKLEKYKLKNIKIYCPLSYGDMEYAKKVIKEGKEIFKDNFIPLSEFMEYDKYLEFLSKIDIAIFAHDRQQAVGNITSLLSMKKTVYLKGSVTTYKMLKDLGIKVKDFNKFENLEKFNDDILEKNREIIKKRFSEKRLIQDLKNIFGN